MEDKIKLYEEILAIDPGSKLFFSLAKLYWQNREIQKAISTLYSGLEKHPEHFEARLFLLNLLIEQENTKDLPEVFSSTTSILENYPDFWFFWSKSLEDSGKKDLALALRFIAYNFSGSDLTWSDIFYTGFQNLEELSKVPDTQKDLDEDLIESNSENSSWGGDTKESVQLAKSGEKQYRTRTMADILVEEGDYQEAVNIYEELYQNSRDSEEKKELKQIISKIKGDYKIADRENNKQRFVQRLSKLSERLEARGV